MKRPTLRTAVLAGYTLVMSLGFLPALVALILQLRGASAVQWSRILSNWISHQGYLPWRALDMVDYYPDAYRGLWLAIALITVGMGLWGMGPARVRWGGPPALGQGQHGTARWRSPRELHTSVARWTTVGMAHPSTGLVIGQGRHQLALGGG